MDNALFRRFDQLLRFELPNAEQVQSIIEHRLVTFKTSKLSWPKVVKAADGLSPGEIVVATEEAAKKTLLSGRERIITADLVQALLDRPRLENGTN